MLYMKIATKKCKPLDEGMLGQCHKLTRSNGSFLTHFAHSPKDVDHWTVANSSTEYAGGFVV